jgi:signal transduction histidine kinase
MIRRPRSKPGHRGALKKSKASPKPRVSPPRRAPAPRPSPHDDEDRRLEQLYEIGRLFASFENVRQTLDPVLGLVTKTLPLRSAIVMQVEDGASSVTAWSADGRSSEQMRAATAHAEAAYAYLVGAPSSGTIELRGLASMSPPPPVASNSSSRLEDPPSFIVIPLAVAQHPPFGALQLEGAQPLSKRDLMFVNAVVNQLAIALDRDRAWRRDITRGDRAEVARSTAEARGVTSERGRSVAESAKLKYEALAAENGRLYEHAQRAVLLREQILAVVSHDLKNPLSAILLTAGSLGRPGAGEERRQGLPRAVGTIQRSAKRMLRLIDDLLDFASIEAGHLAINRQPHDAAAIVRETVASFEAAALAKHLELTPVFEPDLPMAYCDRDRIVQVLTNIIGNATKVTADGGHVTVGIQARGRELVFAVSDDGPGISTDDVKHLFERYWRADEAEYKGTGLGLAIARGIVGAHGGRIWAESTLGRGATFLFTIPTAAATDLRPSDHASGPQLVARLASS